MPDTENLTQDPATEENLQNGENNSPANNENSQSLGKSLRDALGSNPETDLQSTSGNVPNFNVATEEEVQQYINSLPKIDNPDIYKDLKIENEAFADLPQKLMEAKIPPAQIKPLLEYWDSKISDLADKQMSEEDYDQKLHKFMGQDFEKYHSLTDQQMIKYVPKELAESMKMATNDVMVATKMVIAGTIKEYENLIEQIKNDYDVDPSKYKLGSLKSGRVNIEGQRAALTKELFELKLKGDYAGIEKKSAELRQLMGFKENADY